MSFYKLLLLTVAIVTVSTEDPVEQPVISDSCPVGWRPLYRKSSPESRAGKLICLRAYDEKSAWSVAEETCRKGIGELIDLEHLFFLNRRLNEQYLLTLHPEFWSGIRRHQKDVLFGGGIPPKLVTSQAFVNAPWASGQPSNSSGKCVTITGSFTREPEQEVERYTYKSSFSNCGGQKSFFCAADPITISSVQGCPKDYVGSHRWSFCYKMSSPSFSGNYSQAVDECKETGDEIAVYRNNIDNGVVVAAGHLLYKRRGQSGQYQFYVSNGLINEGSGGKAGVTDDSGSGSGSQASGFQASCQFYSLGEVELGFIQAGTCTTVTGVICQRPKTSKPITQEPVTARIESIYSDQSSLRSKSLFSQQPIKCITSRPLTELEVVAFRLNSVPFSARLSSYISESQQVTQIQVPGDSAYENFVGKYTCVVHHKSLNTEIASSDGVYVRYVDTEYVIYRGAVSLTKSLPDDEDLMSFNLGLGTKGNLIGSLTNTLSQTVGSSMSYIMMEFLELLNLNVLKNSRQKITKIRDGHTFEFSVFITLKENNTWFNAKNDQFIISKFKNRMELNMVTPRRRKRQISYSFDPKTIVVKSTGSCPALEIYNKELDKKLYFPASQPQEKVKSSENCITDRRPLATARCAGSFESGFELKEIKINQKCVFEEDKETEATATLKKLSLTDPTPDNIKNITAETANLTSSDGLTNIDVIYTAEILDNIAKAPNFDSETLEDVATIVDNIIRQAEDVLYSAQKVGSATTRIVEALEVVASKLTLQDGENKRVLRPAFVIDIHDISSPSDIVVGLQLDESQTTVIKNESVKLLETASSLVTKDADVAIVLPVALIRDNNKTKLSMFIYGSVKLFRDTRDSAKLLINGKVAAATLFVEGKAVTDLGDQNVKTVYKPKRVEKQLTCGYWNYTLDDNAGGWATDGCKLLGSENGRTICVCDHLTNFAILIDTGDVLDPDHDKALSIISIIGLTLSIIGLSLTVLSFIFFKPLRKGRGQQTLFNLALVMLISWIVFLAGIKATSSYGGCITVAVLIHYLILVTFMWMLIEGFLQYLRFVKVLGTYIPRFMLKAGIVAWGVPLIPIIIVLAIDYNLYYGGKNYCWMTTTALYYAFLLPVGLIILVNIIVFILVIYNLLNRPKGLQTNQSEHKRLMMNFWAALSVFVLLGLTWVFGFFAISEARNAFLYLFTIFNSLQGFFIFILFTFREPQVRQHWMKKFCGKKKAKYTSGDSSSVSHDKKSKSNQSTQFSDLSGSAKNGSKEAFLDHQN